MFQSVTTPAGSVLEVDCGATSIKFCRVDPRGQLLDEVGQVATPYPCWPATLIDLVARVINDSGLDLAGVGFPGDMTDGRVIEPGNLSRAGGITTPVDPQIDQLWQGLDLEGELQQRCRARIRVVNDATLAAHGYAEGTGRELVFTLGTGLGISLVVDDRWQKLRDKGVAWYLDVGTNDEVFGELARATDEDLCGQRLTDALAGFVREFRADLVHVGGDNARHVRHEDLVHTGCLVVFNDYEGTLRGAQTETGKQMWIIDTPLGRLQTPEDVAKVVVFLTSEDDDFITAESISVNVGAFLDRSRPGHIAVTPWKSSVHTAHLICEDGSGIRG